MTDERRAAERLIYGLISWIVAIVGIIVLVPLAWRYLSPFIVALPVAAMLQRPARWLEKKLPIKQSVIRMVFTLLFILMAIALLVWFLSYGIGQLVVLINDAGPLFSGWIADARRAVNSLLSRFNTLQPSETTWIQSTINSALQWLSEQVSSLAGTATRTSVGFVTRIPYALLYANFLFLGIYFISRRYEEVVTYLPGGTRSSIDHLSTPGRLIKSAMDGLTGFVKVQLVYGLVTVVVSVIYWRFFGVEQSLLISLLSGLLELIPLIGNGAVLLPWFLVALILGDYTHSLAALALYLILQSIRRFTEPKLLSHNTGISPLLTLIGMFAGLVVGGIVGLIGGPVVMSVLVSVYRGHYLKPILDDAKAFKQALRVRWGGPLPTDPPEEEKQPQDEQKPESDQQKAGKRKKFLRK
ncbi:MAG: AI-2E family transporter [Clostridia bacterium]|nr:AI-2E family transporter [Clostridia bacterium]